MTTEPAYTVHTAHDHPAVQQLARCIEFLRSVCDGAKSRDRKGFSSFDKNMGHFLASKLATHQGWSREDLRQAVELAWRYREQLGRAGLQFPTAADLRAEIDGMAAEAVMSVAPSRSTATVRLWIDPSGWLVLAFSAYDHAKLAMLLGAVPDADRWWNHANTRWLIMPEHTRPMERLFGVIAGAAPAGEPTVQPNPKRPMIASGPNFRLAANRADAVEIADYDDDRIEVRCPFAMKDTLKAAVPWQAREWRGGTKTWLVDRAFYTVVQRALGLVAA